MELAKACMGIGVLILGFALIALNDSGWTNALGVFLMIWAHSIEKHM